MLGAVHTTGLPCAVANVEKAAENARNAEDKDLPLNVIIEIPRVKLPVAAFGCGEAHISCGSSAAKIRRQFGVAGQQDWPCALNVRSLGSLE
jgi:hypothetical protein